ncbi:hypothetical protein [Streptomyces sp. 8ZJF_21]|uniref:hypothetical protein n=1 Tax=Streptomyces sp. 8ZJF_21 TaxID=2903141 RepID=UPI001E59BCC1|nr:hypothetical protein [Streptomyces sp. 8ZJF_21]MCD9593787.1 hypothetical protein [Streptomyces sp. 8ZJF_21]
MIRHLDEVHAALNRDSHQCQGAGPRSQPGGGPAPEALQEAIGRDTALFARECGQTALLARGGWARQS